MSEDVAKHFLFPNFTTPVPGTMREVLGNDTTLREKISFNGFVITRIKSVGASMMLRTGMGVDQYYIYFQLQTAKTTERLKVPR